jgi:hypothetical protein
MRLVPGGRLNTKQGTVPEYERRTCIPGFSLCPGSDPRAGIDLKETAARGGTDGSGYHLWDCLSEYLRVKWHFTGVTNTFQCRIWKKALKQSFI